MFDLNWRPSSSHLTILVFFGYIWKAFWPNSGGDPNTYHSDFFKNSLGNPGYILTNIHQYSLEFQNFVKVSLSIVQGGRWTIFFFKFSQFNKSVSDKNNEIFKQELQKKVFNDGKRSKNMSSGFIQKIKFIF